MTRSDLIKAIHKRFPELTYKDVEHIILEFFEEISSKIFTGGRVELRNFGIFDVKCRKDRIAYNPKTNKKIQVPPRKVPYFKSGKMMKNRLNED